MSATTTPAPEFGVDVRPEYIPQETRAAAFQDALCQRRPKRIYARTFIGLGMPFRWFICDCPEDVGHIDSNGCDDRLAAIVYPIGVEAVEPPRVETRPCESCDKEWPVDQLAGKLAAICPPCRGEEPAR